MTDYVSANPERLRRLAQLLGNSAGVIKSNEPGIRSAIKSWNQTVDTSALTKLAAWLTEQQRPMGDRAAAAHTALNQPFCLKPSSHEQALKQPRVAIAFKDTPESLALQAKQDAANWAKRMAGKDKLDKLATDMAYAMETHADDPAYLEAFFANGGAKVLAQMPRYEFSVNGLPLLGGSQWRLATYGKAIGIATSLQERGVIKLPPDAWKPITHPENGDMWSSGALVHYVPKDHTFGPTFLHELATSALAWRKAHQPPRPPFFKSIWTGTAWTPPEYVENRDAWWKDLNLSVNNQKVNVQDATLVMEQIRANDPVLAILAKTGANPEASRRLLTGDNGFEHARQLVDIHWQTPGANGPIDDSAGPASVIVAATSDRGPANGKNSAQAALNLINAANDEYNEKRDGLDKEQYPRISPTQAAALSFVASRYLNDLSATGLRETNDINTVVPGGGAFTVVTNAHDIKGFLRLFVADPKASGSFEAAIRASLTLETQIRAQSPKKTDQLAWLGQMLGTLTNVRNALHYDAAARADAAAERDKIFFGIMSGVLESLPLGKPSLEAAQILAAAIAGTFADSLFPTDATEESESNAKRTSFETLNSMSEEIAQGLVQAKVLAFPDPAPFVHNGVIQPRNQAERGAFTVWWSKCSSEFTEYEGLARDGADRAN